MTPRGLHRIPLDTWRRRANRKLRQRRPLRAVVPSPRTVAAAVWQAFRRVAPTLAIVAGIVGLGAAGAAGHRFLTTSPRFAVTDVTVRGHARVSREEILEKAGVAPGTNTFAVDVDAVERAVKELPWVAEARVTRQLPRRLTVEVTERQPAAVVLLGAAYLADFEGRVFKSARLDGEEVDGLVVVTGLDRRTWLADPAAGAAEVRRALAIAGLWRGRPGRPAIGEIHLDRAGTTVFTYEGAVAVRLGREDAGEDLERRLERFDVVWAALTPKEREVARTIYLDSPTRPDRVTIRLADAR